MKFQIFIKSERIYFKKSSIFSLGAPLTFFPSFLFPPNPFFNFGFLFLYISLFILFIAFIFIIIEAYNFEPLNGEFKGFLESHETNLVINNQKYQMEQIKKIVFHNHDYKGKKIILYDRFFNGGYSQGVNNTILLELRNQNNVFKVHFLQSEFYLLQLAKKYLIQYHLIGKLHFLNLIDSLNITDYDEIQNFKKEIYH